MTTERVIGVERLSLYLKGLLTRDARLADLSVSGEISNVKMAGGNGALFFALKEGKAVLECVAWSNAVVSLPHLRDGMKVVVQGALMIYEGRSRYQLRVSAVVADGQGPLHRLLEETKHRLHAAGCFAPERKRPLPSYPFRVGLVTSSAAQGANDFRRVMARRSPHIHLVPFETLVQGDSAADQIAAAIRAASQASVDLIVIVRGGGSFEDLFAFNAEAVVRAICESPVPVLTGIGHEADVSLADLSADRYAVTPTDAANHLPALADLRALTALQNKNLVRAVTQRIATTRALIGGFDARLQRRSPAVHLARQRGRLHEARRSLDQRAMRFISERRQRLKVQSERFEHVSERSFERRKVRFHLIKTRLAGKDPETILALGYAIVRNAGTVVRDARDVSIGMVLEARLAHGTLQARVERTQNDG